VSEKEEKQSMYDKLNDEQKSAQIPYYVHEMEMTRLERINKRLWILILIVFLALIGTNAGWIIYESQFQTYQIEQEVDNGAGNAFVAGVGDVNYGQSPTDNQIPGEEEQFQEPVEGVPHL